MYRNIIFDLGGVLLKLDKTACIRAYNDLGYSGFDKVLSEFHQSGFFLEFEKGNISTEKFRELIRENCRPDVTDIQIDDAMSSFLIEIPKVKLDYILELKQNFNTYILSNTNPVAMKYVLPMFTIDGLTINDYFDELFLSYKLNLAKPDPEVFKYVINKLHLNPSETLFIDDAQSNLDTAETLGINTLFIDINSDFISEIQNKLQK